VTRAHEASALAVFERSTLLRGGTGCCVNRTFAVPRGGSLCFWKIPISCPRAAGAGGVDHRHRVGRRAPLAQRLLGGFAGARRSMLDCSRRLKRGARAGCMTPMPGRTSAALQCTDAATPRLALRRPKDASLPSSGSRHCWHALGLKSCARRRGVRTPMSRCRDLHFIATAEPDMLLSPATPCSQNEKTPMSTRTPRYGSRRSGTRRARLAGGSCCPAPPLKPSAAR